MTRTNEIFDQRRRIVGACAAKVATINQLIWDFWNDDWKKGVSTARDRGPFYYKDINKRLQKLINDEHIKVLNPQGNSNRGRNSEEQKFKATTKGKKHYGI